MTAITLRLRHRPAVPLEAECIRPDAFADLGESEIARQRVWHGKEARPLGDFFDVQGGRASDVRISGETGNVKGLGCGMTGGRLVIEADAGMHAGALMAGGELVIEGTADDFVGTEMRGGLLDIRGNAGDHAGAARAGSVHGMTGGTLIVRGNAGGFAGLRMRRGTIAIAGSAGDHAGAGMVAGTIVVFGDVGRLPGFGLKRGSIIAHGAIEPPPTYRHACTYRPIFVAALLRRLRAEHALDVGSDGAGGEYHRYNGDFAELGKGEILAWTAR